MLYSLKKLGEIATVDWGNTSITKASYKPSGYLAISAAGPDGFLDKFEYEQVAIILSAIGARCGKTFWVEGKWTAIKNTIIIFSKDKNLVLDKYLFYYLTPDKWRIVGGGQPFITKSGAENIKIPLPPPDVQKQIVRRLATIAEAQKLNEELIKKAEELFQSLLHKELDPEGKDWEIKKLGSVFDRITDAILPTKHPEEKFNFIGLENIESNTSRLINISPVAGRFIKSTKTRFKIGDVLYGKLRPYLNKVWLADFDGICSTDIWVLRAKEEIILPQLLGAILQQSSIVQKSSASMAGANLPRANKDIFDKIAIALPSINTQKQIASKLSAVQEYKTQLLEQKKKLKELFDSVLHNSMKDKE